jgi:hypothetical protein
LGELVEMSWRMKNIMIERTMEIFTHLRRSSPKVEVCFLAVPVLLVVEVPMTMRMEVIYNVSKCNILAVDAFIVLSK